jgi:hypothetical protein
VWQVGESLILPGNLDAEFLVPPHRGGLRASPPPCLLESFMNSRSLSLRLDSLTSVPDL